MWSGKRAGCLFGVEQQWVERGWWYSGSGRWRAGKVCVCIGVHTKADAFRHDPPLSHQIDFLQRRNETCTSSRPRHIIWACQDLYQTGSTGAGPFSAVPTGWRIPAHTFLRHIPVPGGVSSVFYGSSGSRVPVGGYSCYLCIVLTENLDSCTPLVRRVFLIP